MRQCSAVMGQIVCKTWSVQLSKVLTRICRLRPPELRPALDLEPKNMRDHTL